MPYIPADDYRRIQHLIHPMPPAGTNDLLGLEAEIYALNRAIKKSPGAGPTREWRELMEQHTRLLKAYRDGGGKNL